MKIVCGLGSIDDYEDFVDAGADELFIGYVPYEWQRINELSNPLNRREVLYSNVNIGSKSELEILSDLVKKRGTKVNIALNGLNFRSIQYEVILDVIKQGISLGFYDYIIADFGLLFCLNKSKLLSSINIHLSGEFGILNSPLIGLLSEMGVKRIIFPRGTSIAEMESIIENYPDMEYEAFFMNEKCHFCGAYCNSIHCDYIVPMCRMPFYLARDNKPMIENSLSILPDKIDYLKIVGRGANQEGIINDIKVAKKALYNHEHGINDSLEGDFYYRLS